MQTYAGRKRVDPPSAQSVPESVTTGQMLHAAGAGAPQPMSEELREKFEPAFGADFSSVRISRGHIPEPLGVQAVARGTNILMDSRAGMDVLGHELAHVVQQAQGRVTGGFPVVHDSTLEHEADVAGARVAAGQSAFSGGGFDSAERMPIAPMSDATAPAQCKSREEKEREKAAKAEMKPFKAEMKNMRRDYKRQKLGSEEISDANKIERLNSNSERSKGIRARTDAFFKGHPDYICGGTTRDLVRFLGNGTDEDLKVSDTVLDIAYNAAKGIASTDEGTKRESSRALIAPFQSSVANLRKQMEPLVERHNKPVTCVEEALSRYKEVREIYNKAQITRDIGDKIMCSGAVEEGDPLHQSLEKDMEYVRGLCDYIPGLNFNSCDVQDGNIGLEGIRTFEQVQQLSADKK